MQYGGAATYEASPTKKNSDTSFVAVPCYSSTDLINWKFEGNALTASSIGATGWVGRLGAAYNAATKKYVLVMQYTGKSGSGELFATSSTPNGAFTFDNVQPTIANVVNGTSGDQAVFNDDDGQAYLVFSNSSGRSHLYVAPLRPADFLAVQPATEVYSSSAGGREGNCMFKYGGRYYLSSSDLHGWNASHTYYVSAANILGPYSAEAVIGGTDADFSHVTQSGLFVTVHGTAQTTVIFGGDRWSDFAGNGIGYNQWVPLTFDGAAPSMVSLSQWSIDTVTGTWSVGPGNNYALNPSFEADRVTMSQPAGWVTSTTTAGATPYTNTSGGHTGNWKWRLVDTSAYDATLSQTIASLPSGTYTLSAWVQSTGGQTVAQLFAKGFGAPEVDAPVDKTLSTWTQVSIPGITVTSGQVTIGVSTVASANQSVTVDDFSLIRN
ncbi:MAG: family 43 glycosylhydrolase [Myxococcales bacterium]|nr:family 43 glycosylhydrolase [Myxococcales bacterium]